MGFVNSQEVAKNAQWRGAREIIFEAHFDEVDPKVRKWTLVVRYKNLKPTQCQVQVSPFYIYMRAHATTSARCAASARASFVRLLRNATLGMERSTWQLKPNESLLPDATNEIEKLGGRVERIERHVFEVDSSSSGWHCVSQDEGSDKHSIPSTNLSRHSQHGWYPCCCAAGYEYPLYRSHAGKKCKDGSYDMTTICNRGHCKQCGGRKEVAAGANRLRQCCGDAFNNGRYQTHEGPRCQDGSYDMRSKANRGRCKLCGVLNKIEPTLGSISTMSCTNPATSNVVPVHGEYKCCCNSNGHNHPLYRSHRGKTCKDESYDTRCHYSRICLMPCPMIIEHV